MGRVSDVFPPLTSREAEVSLALGTFAAVIEGRQATYVSSPLTTGPRAYEWHQRNGSKTRPQAKFKEDVLEPNKADASKFVKDLRKRTSRIVIDPTALPDLPGWEQSDYRFFWGRVIETYCDQVILRDGWQFSSGCSYEYFVAASLGLTTLRENMAPLPFSEAHELLQMAIAETERHGTKAAFLRSVSDALMQEALRVVS
jgi:hypothetical protein